MEAKTLVAGSLDISPDNQTVALSFHAVSSGNGEGF